MAEEKRLIDANALKERAIPDYESGEMLLYGSMVDEAHTVDAVEVVRCKDCRHYRHFKGCGNWCHKRFQSDIEFKAKPNDFCSYGERENRMTNKQRAYFNIQRAIGMIEGVSYGLSQAAPEALCDAIEVLDEALDEIMKEDKPNEG